jgi:hypothetical protein
MPDEVALLANVLYCERYGVIGPRRYHPQCPRVVGLTATGRIKGSLVERNRPVPARDDLRLKRREIRVAQIEQFGQ